MERFVSIYSLKILSLGRRSLTLAALGFGMTWGVTFLYHNFESSNFASLQLYSRVGGILPVYSGEELNTLPPIGLRFLAFVNVLLRFLTYPISFAFILFFSVTSVLTATLYDLFGGGFEVTGDYNQTAIKHVLWMILDFTFFLIDQTKLFVGIFFPSTAASTLTHLMQQIDTLPDDILTKNHRDIPYLQQVIRVGAWIQSLGFREGGMAVAALLSEPVNSIVAGVRMNRGLSGYSVNPTVLSRSERAQIPVLLVHGDEHNDTAVIPLLDKLRQEKYSGPIFTVNIPNMQDDELRKRMIDTKLHEIDRLYNYQKVGNEAHIRCFCIGHSSGADALVELQERDMTTQRLLILLGAIKHVRESPKRESSLIYFNAKTDVVLSMPSEDKHRDLIKAFGEVHTLNTGHLGLLTHPEVLERCYSLLVSRDTQTFFVATPTRIKIGEEALRTEMAIL